MVARAVRKLQRATEYWLTDSATGTAPDNTTYTDPKTKLEIRASGSAGQPDEESPTTDVQRGTLYARVDAPFAAGWRVSMNGVDWFVATDDRAASSRANLKCDVLREINQVVARNVTLHRMIDGFDTTIGPFAVHVHYENIQASEVESGGSRTRRVDGRLVKQDGEFPVRAGDLFIIDMGDGMSLAGQVIDVNRSVAGTTQASISVTRGVATPARRTF